MKQTIKLTDSQVSALECRADGGLEPSVEIAWNGRRDFNFDDSALSVGTLFHELTGLANAEDADAEMNTDKVLARKARGACLALSNLSLKVLKAGAVK